MNEAQYSSMHRQGLVTNSHT